ncbi:MAG: hypothetical protein WAT81_05085 [Candidatus Moraniibacteriota bacterium]
MVKRFNPNEGTMETPPDHAVLLQQLEDDLLAPKALKSAVPIAVPETTPLAANTGPKVQPSPERLEHQAKIIDELERQKTAWIARIQSISTKKEFEALNSESGANGKYSTVPCFVVGRPLGNLFKQHGVDFGLEADVLKEKAHVLQAEIGVVYLTKKAELYPQVDASKKSAPSATPIPAVSKPVSPVSGEPTQAEIDAYIAGLDSQVTDERRLSPFSHNNVDPVTPAAPVDPIAPPVKEETLPMVTVEGEVFLFPRLGKDKKVHYQSADGSVYEISKKTGGYRITKVGDPKILSISRAEILKRGQAEGWRLVSNVVPETARETSITEDEERVLETYEIRKGDVWVRGEEGRGDWDIIRISDVGGTHINVNSYGGSAMGDTYGSGGNIELEDLQKKLRDGGYVLSAEVVNSDQISAPLIETRPESGAAFLNDGEEAVYRTDSPEGGLTVVRVKKEGAVYYLGYFQDTKATQPVRSTVYDEKGIRNFFDHYPLVRIEATDAPVPSPEAVPLGVAIGQEALNQTGSTGGDIEKRISTLREEVAETRAAFIAVEESQQSAWKNLTRIFRGLSHKASDDGEVAKYQSWYDEKILALQNAELEKLKQSGLPIKELRPAMAALIREFEFDEAERIYDVRKEIRHSKTSQPVFERMKTLWNETAPEGSASFSETNRALLKLMLGSAALAGEATVQAVEKIGTANNKFSRKYGKYLITATVAGAGAVSLGVIALPVGVGAASVGLLALKRAIGGAGVAVTIETVAESYAKKKREVRRNRVEADHETHFDAMEADELAVNLGEKASVDFSKLETYLKEVSAKIRKGEGARRRNELLRKSGAAFAGAVLGSGAAVHLASEYISGGSKAHAAVAALQGQYPEAVGSGPAVGNFDDRLPAETVPADKAAESLKDSRAVPVSVETPGVAAPSKELLTLHEVKRGDSIWKLATKAVQDVPDMNERSSERFAKLVEVKLQTKLDASSDLARAAGFTPDADGKFSPHHIQKGAKLELGKLFSADEMTKLIEEAKGDTPISVPSVAVPDVPSRETVSPIPTGMSETELAARETDHIAEKIPVSSADEKAAIVATFAESPTTELIKPDGSVMKYVETLPRDEQEKLFRNFKRLSMGLFQTNEVMGGEVYDMRYDPAVHPELAKTRLATVLADHKLLAKNPFTGYDRIKNPLHGSQMQEVMNFSRAAAKAFGESVAVPKNTESVQEYVLRMVAIARNQGVKIPGFRMLD